MLYPYSSVCSIAEEASSPSITMTVVSLDESGRETESVPLIDPFEIVVVDVSPAE